MRSESAQAIDALLHASDGHVGAFARLLEAYPGDELLRDATRGELRRIASRPSIPEGSAYVAELLGTLDDPFPMSLLDQHPELKLRRAGIGALVEEGLVDRDPETDLLRVSHRLHAFEPRDLLRDFALAHPDELPATAGRLHPDPEQAVPLLLRAAASARSERRFGDADHALSLALERAPGSIDAAVARALFLGERGRHGEGIALVDSLPYGRARLAHAKLLQSSGRYAESAELAPLDDEDLEVRSESESVAARSAMLAADYERATRITSEALARDRSHPYRAELLDVSGMVALYTGDARRARTTLEAALAVALELADEARADRIRANLAVTLHKEGAVADAESSYRASIDGAKRRGDFRAQLLRQINLATLLHERGKFADALASYRRAAEIARIIGDDRSEIRTAINWANLEGWLGNSADALERATHSLHVAERLGARSEEGYLRLLCAEQSIALRDLKSAHTQLRNAEDLLASSSIAHIECTLMRAQLALREENSDEATREAQSALQLARDAGRESLALTATLWLGLAAAESRASASNELLELLAHGQALAAKRFDPDHGWLIATLRSELGDTTDNLLATARQLASEARSRLTSEHERSYSRLWYRVARWRTLKTIPSPTEDPTRDFDRLLAINRELARDHDPDRLLDRIIDAAIALSGAE
ncbi:MAG: hypothetical protein AAF658_11760, partial [Myxococcota bacterium]